MLRLFLLFRRPKSAALVAVLPLALAAQTAPSPASPAKPSSEDPITLSPFEVSTDRDIGYAASSAMSATRTNEKLENLPNSISVLNQDFLQDIAANNFLDAVDFAVGAENIVNDSGTRGAPQGTRSGTQIAFRGMASFRQLRDGFPWYVPQDMYKHRAHRSIARARRDWPMATSMRAGSSTSAPSAPNSATSTADRSVTTPWNATSLVDLNKVIVPNRLSARFNAIDLEDEKSRQRTETAARASPVRCVGMFSRAVARPSTSPTSAESRTRSLVISR
jgi:hypothetical protein